MGRNGRALSTKLCFELLFSKKLTWQGFQTNKKSALSQDAHREGVSGIPGFIYRCSEHPIFVLG
jgi:hypothetical protein